MERWPGAGPDERAALVADLMRERELDAARRRRPEARSTHERAPRARLRPRLGRLIIRLGTAIAGEGSPLVLRPRRS